MAQTDLTGLLTGITSQPISPTAGLSREGRMAARAQGMADTMRRGIIGASGQDPRTIGQRAQSALAQLDPNKKEDRVQILEIVSRVNPERAVALRAAFAEADKATAQEEKVEGRAARRMEIAEETFEMQKAASKRELDQADALLAQQGVSRALFAQQARENGNEQLAKAIETGGISLEKAGSILFGSSNALVKPATPEETEAFDRILNTAEFEEKIKNLKTGWVWKTLSGETKQAIYFKAKELMARGKLSTEDALTKAIEAVEALDLPTGGDGGGGGSRKNRRDTGGNVPESKTDDAFGEV